MHGEAAARHDAQTRAAAAYYGRDSAWYDDWQDSDALDGTRCSQFPTVDHIITGAQCYDAACAPPLVRAFSCGPLN